MSWAASKKAAQKYGKENTKLLFTDTKIEDEDLYRFLNEGAKNIGSELITIADGRTPWEVFKDVKMLGNSKIDPCSRILKRELAQKWIKQNCDPADTVLVFGIHISEVDRFDNGDGRGVKHVYEKMGWKVEAPMCERPHMGYYEIVDWLKKEGLEIPKLYKLGFSHNNCGGGCVKAGKGAFAHLLKTLPDVYKQWEENEKNFYPHTILTGISLEKFREHIENNGKYPKHEIGGCSCFIEPENSLSNFFKDDDD